jgi:transcriptional regulator with XRE-family HTH domain
VDEGKAKDAGGSGAKDIASREEKPRLDLTRVPGANVRRLREERLLSQLQLALDSGLNRSEIERIEQGLRNPGSEVLVKIAGALKVEPGELLKGCIWSPENEDFDYTDSGS